MKRYERKSSQATKNASAVGGASPPQRDWAGKPLLHAKAAKAGWLAKYKAEAVKLKAKKRPSKEDQERLKKLREDIRRLASRKPAKKASAAKKAPVSRGARPAISQNHRAFTPSGTPRRTSATGPAAKKRVAPVAKKRAAKVPVRKRPARKIPVVKKSVRKIPVVKRRARKVPVRKRTKPASVDVSQMSFAELTRFELAAAKRRRELQAEQTLIAEEYTQDPEQMKDHLLELRDEAISRGEVEVPQAPFGQPLPENTRMHRGQKIYVKGEVFLSEPGVILEVMVNVAHAANKLIPVAKSTWIAMISILVYGQKTFGSPPLPWAGKTPDAALFQVQSYASTGAQPTKIGMLDAFQETLDAAAETHKTVVWLEYLTIQQFTPLDTEEKKAWRREQARKKREQRAKLPRLRRGKLSKVKKKVAVPKKKRVQSGRKSSASPKRLSKSKKATFKPKKASSRFSKPKKTKAKKKAAAKAKRTRGSSRKTSTSSRSKVR